MSNVIKITETLASHDRLNLPSVLIFRPLMIVTQKITTLAFQLHDGKAAETHTHTHTLMLNP